MGKCETCDFWRKKDDQPAEGEDVPTVGVCFLEPPRLMLMPTGRTPQYPQGGAELRGMRPNTTADEGCSHHGDRLLPFREH